MAHDVGIVSFGAYVPRLRLQRKAIAAANAWFNPGLRGMAKGERSMANRDEDTVTMAVEAARDCLGGVDAASVASLSLASTTHPFDDRQNTSIAAGALNLRPGVRSLDVAGSLRAGTSALATAFAAARGAEDQALVIAAEHRLAKAASTPEMHSSSAPASRWRRSSGRRARRSTSCRSSARGIALTTTRGKSAGSATRAT